jgi:hypothetical protein
LIQPQILHQRLTLRLSEILPEHNRHRIANIGEHGEGNQRNGQHHRQRLQNAGDDEGEQKGVLQ